MNADRLFELGAGDTDPEIVNDSDFSYNEIQASEAIVRMGGGGIVMYYIYHMDVTCSLLATVIFWYTINK